MTAVPRSRPPQTGRHIETVAACQKGGGITDATVAFPPQPPGTNPKERPVGSSYDHGVGSPQRLARLPQLRLRGTPGINPLLLPLIHIAGVDPVLAILLLFLLAALLQFFTLLATVAHSASSVQCKPPSPSVERRR